jgi:hypothetical protein
LIFTGHIFILKFLYSSFSPQAAKSGFFYAGHMPFALSPAITIIIAIAIVVLSFGGGFAVADWRKSGQLEDLRGKNNQLVDANDRCAGDIKSAKAAMQAMTAVSQERERQAQESMKEAQPQVEKRTAIITRIKALPAVPLDQQCEAIKQEQIEYVRERRGE